MTTDPTTLFMATAALTGLLHAVLQLALIGVAAVWVRPAHEQAWLWIAASGALGMIRILATPFLQAVISVVGVDHVVEWQAGIQVLQAMGGAIGMGLLLRGLILLAGPRP